MHGLCGIGALSVCGMGPMVASEAVVRTGSYLIELSGRRLDRDPNNRAEHISDNAIGTECMGQRKRHLCDPSVRTSDPLPSVRYEKG